MRYIRSIVIIVAALAAGAAWPHGGNSNTVFTTSSQVGNGPYVLDIGCCENETATVMSCSVANGATVTVAAGTGWYLLRLGPTEPTTGWIEASFVNMETAANSSGMWFSQTVPLVVERHAGKSSSVYCYPRGGTMLIRVLTAPLK